MQEGGIFIRDEALTKGETLEQRFPDTAPGLPRVVLTTLPTPLERFDVDVDDRRATLLVKRDDLCGIFWGGNKLRKLEYLFGRIAESGAEVVATFGTVASNHALATAVCARKLGYEPLCFLSHQTRTPLARDALAVHAGLGSRIVPFGGSYPKRLAILRRHLGPRAATVFAMGGSSWTGTVGFINAGLELAEQLVGDDAHAYRVYIATGTMGSAAGLALGLALAGIDARVEAVRVSPTFIANEAMLRQTMCKAATMLHRLDDKFPAGLADEARIELRGDCFGDGYARSTPRADEAILLAQSELKLTLEPTYTGKAMAALLADWQELEQRNIRPVFWNTYHPLPDVGATEAVLPDAFSRYLG